MRFLKSSLLPLALLLTSALRGQEEPPKVMDIYGHVMLDMGWDFGRVNPDWFDVLRPTKLLDGSGNPYTPKGNFFMGVRQTRFGVKNYFQTGLGELKTWFEFEMIGTGVDAGQTTFRLRHAYAELGKWGFGQTNSVFMDGDVFPNSLEYWGPNGMPFFRNVQLRYMAIQKEHQKLTFALERPGASADQGQYGAGFEYADLLSGIKFKFPMPDLTAEYRHGGKWGYVELGGILRNIRWKDTNPSTNFDFNGGTIGWGLNLSTNLKVGKKAVFRGSVTTGAGVQNYMNDADVDIGVKRQYTNNRKPIDGEAIPMLGLVAFMDVNWSDKFSSTIGYSRLTNNTSDNQLSTAFQTGEYALANLLYYPAKNCMMGAEIQWGARRNNDFAGDPVFNLPAAEGNSASTVKLQFSFKYNFSHSFYKK